MHAFYEVRLSFHALIISYIGNIVNIINKLLFLSRLYIQAGCSFFTPSLEVFLTNNNLYTLKIAEVATVNNSWCLSTVDYQLYAPNGISIKLTIREFKFLELLFQARTLVNKVIIQDVIIARGCHTADQRIAVMVTRLRKKVSQQAGCLLPIKSDYTNGYLFAGPSCFIDQSKIMAKGMI